MSTFNRIVVTLLLLALVPIVTIALIAPLDAVDLLRDVLDEIEAQLDPSPSTAQVAIMAGLALLIDLVLIVLIYLELRSPKETSVRVQRAEGGEAQIAIDSVVNRVRFQVDRLPGVLEVEPSIVPRRGGVEVILDVEMADDGRLSATIEEISAITRRVVEEEMGLELKGKPKLNLRTVDYSGRVLSETPQIPEPAPADEAALEIEPEAGGGETSQQPEAEDESPSGAAEGLDELDADELDESGSTDA
jgi:hypothetical protein